MLESYMSYLEQNVGFGSFIILYILLFHPLVLAGIMYFVFKPLTSRKAVITACIFFILIAVIPVVFHNWLFLTIAKDPDLFNVAFLMTGVCVMFYGLVFQVFVRSSLLKAWYGKKVYQEMITAPDYFNRLELYSHPLRVKMVVSTMCLSLLALGIIAVVFSIFPNAYGRIILCILLSTGMGTYTFHMYVTQHLIKCDCCGRKALHFVHEHPVYKSWIRQMLPITFGNRFYCVFCGVKYALSRRTLFKMQQQQARKKQLESSRPQEPEEPEEKKPMPDR